MKISVLVWRLLQDRLPTKFNLFLRNVLGSDQIQCSYGCGEVESTDTDAALVIT